MLPKTYIFKILQKSFVSQLGKWIYYWNLVGRNQRHCYTHLPMTKNDPVLNVSSVEVDKPCYKYSNNTCHFSITSLTYQLLLK